MNGCLCGICCKGSVDWISGSHFCEVSPPAGAPLRPADRRVDALSARALETAIACSCRRNYKHENNHPDDICGGFSQQFSFPSERSNRKRKLREQAGLGCVMFVCFGSSASCIIKQSLFMCIQLYIYIYRWTLYCGRLFFEVSSPFAAAVGSTAQGPSQSSTASAVVFDPAKTETTERVH